MKKVVFRLTAIVISLTIGQPLSANSAVPDTLEQLPIKNQHSIKIKKTNRAEFTFQALFPASGNLTLRQNMTEWVNEMLSTLTQVKQTDKNKTLAPDEMIDYYQKNYLKQAKAEIQELIKTRDSENKSPVNYVTEIKIERLFETTGLITYRANAYTYGGGAHGMSYSIYASFRKSDGKILTWDDLLLPKQRTRFSPLVADGIMQYFGMTDFTSMKSRLQIEGSYSRNRFPLPKGNPGLSADGLRVQYALYEIAPYAAGAPSAIIPYSKLRTIMTPAARKLIQ